MVLLGKADTITKDYIRDTAVFADIFNKFLFHGKLIISADSLKELDTTEIAVPYGTDDSGIPNQKYRDVLKVFTAMTDGNAAYCILGVEGQVGVHYAMPVRNALYDFMQLSHQVSETALSHKKMKHQKEEKYKPGSDEYLSGFWKTDKLVPVITLVIYWGSGAWDGPMSLKDMYAIQDEAFLKYAPDYHINLIAPYHMTNAEIDEFHTSFREIMLYIKYSSDGEKLDKIISTDDKFKKVSRQAVEVLNAVTNSELKYPNGEEEIDMCLAIQKMKEESENLGKIIGFIQASKGFGKTQEETIKYILTQFKIETEQAIEYVNEYW